MAEQRWLLLAYKVPRKSSASRVYVWRKLKRLGAIALQDAVWVLPDTPRSKEQFRWLAAEISELKGEATLWAGNLTMKGQEEAFIRRFQEEADAQYQRLLSSLRAKDADLGSLSRQFQEAQSRDFFKSKFCRKVRQALLKAKDGSER
jgi:hypothetical protein